MSKNEKLLITLLAIIAIAVCIYFYKKSKAVAVPPKEEKTVIVRPPIVQSPDISKYLTPIVKADIHGTNPGALKDILGADLIPTCPPCLFRTMICIKSSSLFAVIFKNGNISPLFLNSGIELNAGCAYIFDILVHSEDKVNFQVSNNAVIVELKVQELVGGTQ